jgi:hypothetical protein
VFSREISFIALKGLNKLRVERTIGIFGFWDRNGISEQADSEGYVCKLGARPLD